MDFDDDWAGRYFVTKGELVTMGAGPSIGYRLNEQWSIGGSVFPLYGQLKWKSTRWFTFVAVIVSLPCVGASDCDFDQDGDLDIGDLVSAAQNPIPGMISLPFRNSTNFYFEPCLTSRSGNSALIEH